MNTGMQDAVNLAWKLALVSRGTVGAALLDSYDAQRRAVDAAVIASAGRVENNENKKASLRIFPRYRNECAKRR